VSFILLFGITGIGFAENQPVGPGGPPPDPAKMEAEFKSGLEQLVKNNVITPKQEDTIIRYFRDMRGKNGPPPSKEKGNPPQDQANPLSTLVKNGVITQEQAKAIEKIMPKPPMPKK